MTYESLLNQPNLYLLKGISGSRAYGTNVQASDTDIRGVFMLPQKDLYGLSYTEQVADERNDIR
jgi:uncharacterized protein